MLIRLSPGLGGDGRRFKGITAINDTGSDLLTLFDYDLDNLGNLNVYHGWNGYIQVRDANGLVQAFPTILVQVQLADNNWDSWSNWFFEEAIVRQGYLGVPRLTGAGIRSHFFMGTPAGNDILSVSTSKAGLTSLF